MKFAFTKVCGRFLFYPLCVRACVIVYLLLYFGIRGFKFDFFFAKLC